MLGSDKDGISLDALSVAIVGMSCRMPNASSVDEFWVNLRDGIESVRELTVDEMLERGTHPDEFLRPDFVPYGSYFVDRSSFAGKFFGYSPREVELMDPQHRLLLECVWTAIEDAGYPPRSLRVRTSLFTSISLSSYLLFNLLGSLPKDRPDERFQAMIGTDKEFAATRISYKLNLRGPSLAVQTGCSSSLVAVHLAVQSLLTHECDLAIVGAASVGGDSGAGYRYVRDGILSEDGHTRSFDASASGTVFGEGGGVVVLKRLEDVDTDHNHVYAVIRGTAVNNDGRAKVGYTAPSIEGQADVIKHALNISGLTADQIGYVEAHGTATKIGDPVEISALTKAFRETTDKLGFCGIGSVKSNLGHLDAAAGIAGLIKTCLILKHRSLVKSLNFTSANPAICFEETPFYVVQKFAPWPTDGPARAGISSFGIGGTNAHLILEEHRLPPRCPKPLTREIVALSAESDAELDRAQDDIVRFLEEASDIDFLNLVYTLNVGREGLRVRRAFMPETRSEALEMLKEGRGFQSGIVNSGPAPAVVFMFPGGGSQYSEMGRGLYRSERLYRDTIDRGNRCLLDWTGIDHRSILFEGKTEGSLTSSTIGLPCLFMCEVALAILLMERGVEPTYLIGHSLGEYAAAHLAGVFTFEEALDLVLFRGRLLDELPSGAMLSIELSEAELMPLLIHGVSIAAVNSPRRCVVAGPIDRIRDLQDRLAGRECHVSRLHINVAAHSPLLDPVLDRFREKVESLNPRRPSIPIVSSLTGNWLSDEEATSTDYWVRQLREPVRFASGLTKLASDSHSYFFEVGPSNVLQTYLSETCPSEPSSAVMRHLRNPVSDEEHFYLALAKAWAGGVRINWERFYESRERSRISAPTYSFEKQMYWVKNAQASELRQASTGPVHSSYEAYWVPFSLTSYTRHDAGRSNVWVIFSMSEACLSAFRNAVTSWKPSDCELVFVHQTDVYAQLDDNNFRVARDIQSNYEELLGTLRDRFKGPLTLVVLDGSAAQSGSNGAAFATKPSVGDELSSLICILRAAAKALDQAARNCDIAVVCFEAARRSLLDDRLTEYLPLGQCAIQEGRCRRFKVIYASAEQTIGLAQDTNVKKVLEELDSGQLEPEILLMGEARYVRRYRPLDLIPSNRPSQDPAQPVYLLIGGFGRIGRSLAEFLTERGPCTLIIVSRSGSVREDHRNTSEDDSAGNTHAAPRHGAWLSLLRGRGARVEVHVLDIARRADTLAFLDGVYRRYPKLDVIFHLAGLGGETSMGLIDDLTPDMYRQQLAPKADGVIHLSEGLLGRSYGLCVAFSSTASKFGGVGIAAYAMANSRMDAIVTSQYEREGRRWLSIGWDAWVDDGQEHVLKYGVSSLDKYAIGFRTAFETLWKLIGSTHSGAVLVSSQSPSSRIASILDSQNLSSREGTETCNTRRSLTTAFASPTTELELAMATVWSRILGLEQVGIDDSFFEMGGNSLIALRLVSRLRDELALDLNVLTLFQSPTIRRLAANLEGKRRELEELKGFRRGAVRRNRRRDLIAREGEAVDEHSR